MRTATPIVHGARVTLRRVVVPWHGASIDRPDFFWDDGIHLRPEGAAAYAALIASQITL